MGFYVTPRVPWRVLVGYMCVYIMCIYIYIYIYIYIFTIYIYIQYIYILIGMISFIDL